MVNTPQIRLIFVLTKNDSSDFDRDAVSRLLCISPSETSAPRLGKGRLYCDADLPENEKELSGVTLLPAAEPPYQMLLHAAWSFELPKQESWTLEEPLQQLEQLLTGKEAVLLQVCKDHDLSADLIVRVFAEANNMPDLTIPGSSLSFWASINAAVSFDFYLD